MPRHLPLLVAGCLLAAQVAQAQQTCPSVADQQVFEIAALKSEMMVLATDCHMDQNYNTALQRYQAYIAANEHQLSAYFQRKYGRRAQPEYDGYVTSLANAQSSEAIKQGSVFCERGGTLFAELMKLRGENDLAQYAAAKALFPASFGACEAASPVAAPARGATRRARRPTH